MFDPGDDSNWEWFEVYNAGSTDFDLNGSFLDDDTGRIPSDALPNIALTTAGGVSNETVVPAGGTAIIYDGFNLEFDDARFRRAWELNASVPVIAADFFPDLRNSGDTLGIWPSLSAYQSEDRVIETDEFGEPILDEFGNTIDVGVGSSNNATAYLDFRPTGFYRGNDSASMAWNGQAPIADPTNWAEVTGVSPGARISVPTTLPSGTPLNDTNDVGNPGILPPGTLPTGLVFTEIMFNSRSADASNSDFEWVELYNNSASDLDFSAAGATFYFDDDDGGPVSAPNVASGSIPAGSVGILFDANQMTVEQMQTAWGASNIYIPVTEWSALGNGGDDIALWDDATAYADAKTADTLDDAIVVASYNGDIDDGFGSYTLAGTGWEVSYSGDDYGSYNANEVLSDSIPDHEGGDVGSPGFFTVVEPPLVDLDFNDDTFINSADIDQLIAAIIAVKRGGDPDLSFDVDGDGNVTDADRDEWLEQAGPANGLAGAYLLGDLDLNGFVNVEDFGKLNSGFNVADQYWSRGDINADGNTTVEDFGILNSNFGLSTPIPSSAGASAVPEPQAWSLLLLALGGMAAFIRRRPA